jgi:hypothetical protein
MYYNGIHISGNFNKLTKNKPRNWVNRGYKIVVPFTFKWRHKIGKVECDCKVCEEHYQPWYGVSFYHSKGCAFVEEFNKRPQLLNLWQYSGREIDLIAIVE